MAEEPGYKTRILQPGKFSVLHTECLKVILCSLSTASWFHHFYVRVFPLSHLHNTMKNTYLFCGFS